MNSFLRNTLHITAAALVSLLLVGPAQAQLRAEHGGTSSLANTGADDSILVGDGDSFEEKTIPDCVAGAGYLNYTQSSNTWSCNDLSVALAGDTMTGPLHLDNTTIEFEGATPDAFETALSATDPTADRAITFPDAAGGVVLDSGTGTAACSNGQILKQSAGVWACGADVNTGVTSIANDLWVSTDGVDSPNDCSVGQPCATIQYAIIQVFTNRPPEQPTTPWRINVAPGTYTEDDIQFTEDGTSAGQPVDYITVLGSGELATSINGDDVNQPIFDLTGAGHIMLQHLTVKGKLGQAVANIYYGPGWHNIRIWNVGSTAVTTTQGWAALEIAGVGETTWVRDFTPFNLSASEAAPLIRLHLGGGGTGEAGFCTDGTKFGACLVAADCGTGGDCKHNAGDTLFERGFYQADGMAVHITGMDMCYGGATSITQTSVDPTASTTLEIVGGDLDGADNIVCESDGLGLGNGCADDEVVVGEMIHTVTGGETRTIESITDADTLVVTVAFTDTASGDSVTVSNDGWPCDVDGDCDTSGVCGEGLCDNNNALSCTEANEGSDCGGTPDCLVGQAFNNIWLDNRWQVAGDESGVCSMDTDTTCLQGSEDTMCTTTCTTDGDCDDIIPGATCVEHGATDYCSCEPMALWIEGDRHGMTISQDDFVCNKETASCTDPTAYLAAVGGATIDRCGVDVLDPARVVGYTTNGNTGAFTDSCVYQPIAGGTGLDTSSSSGHPFLTAGVWSVLADPLPAANGGTALDTSASTGIPLISSGTWSVLADPLPVANGGTALTSLSTFVKTDASSNLASSTIVTALTGADIRVTDAPGTGTDVTNKTYVDITRSVAQGGTGETTYTTGDILIAAGATDLDPLSGTVNRYLKYAGTAPLWTTIDLSDTTGSFANALDETLGGFGEALDTADGEHGSSNCVYVRRGSGENPPRCHTLPQQSMIIRQASGVEDITFANNTVLIKPGSNPTDATAISNDEVLGKSGTGALGSVKLENDMWSGVGGEELAVDHGGTGLTTIPADAVMLGAGTSDVNTAVLPDCDTGGQYLQFDTTGNTFTCIASPVTVFVSTCPGTSASANCNITNTKRYGKIDSSEHGYRPENRNIGVFGWTVDTSAASKAEFECTVTRMTCSSSVAMDTSPDGPVDCGFRNITDASESVFCTIAAGATTCTGTGSEAVGLGDDVAPFFDCDDTNSACPSANGQYSLSAYCTE